MSLSLRESLIFLLLLEFEEIYCLVIFGPRTELAKSFKGAGSKAPSKLDET